MMLSSDFVRALARTSGRSSSRNCGPREALGPGDMALGLGCNSGVRRALATFKLRQLERAPAERDGGAGESESGK